ESFNLACAAGDGTPADLERAHMLAGIAARIAGDETQARMHFLAVFAEDVGATLPADRNEARAPKVTTFFELVRGEVKATKATTTPPPTTPPPTTPPPPTTTKAPPAATTSLLPLGIVGAGVVVAGAGAGVALLADNSLTN